MPAPSYFFMSEANDRRLNQKTSFFIVSFLRYHCNTDACLSQPCQNRIFKAIVTAYMVQYILTSQMNDHNFLITLHQRCIHAALVYAWLRLHTWGCAVSLQAWTSFMNAYLILIRIRGSSSTRHHYCWSLQSFFSKQIYTRWFKSSITCAIFRSVWSWILRVFSLFFVLPSQLWLKHWCASWAGVNA